jgi:hypothetical protein
MTLRQEIQTLKQQKDGYLSRLKVLIESHMKFVETAEKDFAEEERRFEADQRDLESRKQSAAKVDAPGPAKGFKRMLDEVIEHQRDALKEEVPPVAARSAGYEQAESDAFRESHHVQPAAVPDPASGAQAPPRPAGKAEDAGAPGWSLDRLKRDILAGTSRNDENS